ncbi:MAG: PAS domain S-box protein [Candidatus Marinimicrobia bacterium]|nr:PAS domain S-box protein [Candidatus Neomarinimicrobiota bacterium]MCF7829533.1 PAS domain S-box protein [Candidatus Neomarinimicrobiota bacterium]MCF7880069.1 PAS domain S-box protein [Candidatus Neomarinimicrobiota bacterium]
MNFYALLSLVSAVVTFVFGNFVYYKEPHKKINRLYFIFASLGAFVALCEFMVRSAESYSVANFWDHLATPWLLFPPILLHLILLLRDQEKKYIPVLAHVFIYVPAVVFMILNGFTNLVISDVTPTYWGWTHVPADSLLGYLVSVWVSGLGFVTLWFGVRYYRDHPESEVKRQLRYILAGAAFPVFIGFLTEGVFKHLRLEIPGMSTPAFMIGSILIGYGIWKHRMVVLTPATAAREIFATMADSLLISNVNGIIVMANKSALTLLGYKESELVGQPISTIFHKELVTRFGTISPKTKGETVTGGIEAEVIAKSGNRIPVALTISGIQDPFSDEYGEVYGIRDLTEYKRNKRALETAYAELEKRVEERTAELQHMNTQLREEISVRKKVELALRDSENDYRELFENAHDAIIIFNPDHEKVLDVNERGCELYGIPRGDFINMSLEEISLDVDMGKYHIKKTLAKGYNHSFETRHRRQDGSIMDVEINASVTQFRDQWAILSINRDITERKKTEEILRRTQFAVDNARDAIYWIGKDAEIVYVNDAACEELQYSREELLAMTVFDIDPVFPRDEWYEHWQRSVDLGSYMIETVHRTRDGTDIPVEIAINIMEFDGQTYHCDFSRNLTRRKQAQEELVKSERQLKESQKIARIGHYTVNLHTGWWEGSDTVYEILGISTDYQRDLKGSFQLIHPDDRANISAYLLDESNYTENGFNREFRVCRPKDGKTCWVHLLGRMEFDEDGELARIIGTLQDITDRRKAEDALRLSEARLTEAQRIARVGNWDLDLRTNKIFWSAEVYRIFDLEPGDGMVTQEFFLSFIPAEERAVMLGEVERAIATGSEYKNDYAIILKDGRKRHVHAEGKVGFDGDSNPARVYGTIQDVTEVRRIERELKNSLQEKEVLLKEIHHRVKNNMQVISSLLNLQARDIQSEETLRMFRESENRIRSMALIHEQLYQASDLASINFGEYIPTLSRTLFSSYSQSAERVKLSLDVEQIMLGIDTAIPCGLIINELVSNALKYAFPEDQQGEILIGFHKEKLRDTKGDDDRRVRYILNVSDNGIGYSDDIKSMEANSLGLQLVKSLVQQLKGTIQVENGHGLRFQIEFQDIDRSTFT